jgi:hypothetical protein
MKKLKLEDITQNQDELQYQQLTSTPDTPSDLISLKAIDELLNIKKLKTISRVKFEQVPVLSKLYLFTDIFGEGFTKNLADTILQLQISVSGLGRREMVQLVQQRNQMFDTLQQQPKSSKDIFR